MYAYANIYICIYKHIYRPATIVSILMGSEIEINTRIIDVSQGEHISVDQRNMQIQLPALRVTGSPWISSYSTTLHTQRLQLIVSSPSLAKNNL